LNKLLNFILLNILLSTAIFANTDSLEKVSLQLQWKHQFEFAGFYIAKEKGFYKEAGLDVEIKEFSNDVNVVADVCDGNSTFGTYYPSLVLEKSKGHDVVLLSAILQSSPHVLVSLKSSGIKSIQDFKNKKIMTHTGTMQTTAFTSMLKAGGVNLEEMIRLKHTFDIEDLLRGKIDIMSAFASNELYTLDKRGIEYDIWDPKDCGFDFYDVLLFTSVSKVKENPQMVKDFRDASLKGWKYAFEHIDEAVNLILKKYNTQNKTREAFLYEAKTLKELAYSNESKLGSIDENKIQRIYDIYNLMGLAKGSLDIEDFIFEAPVSNQLLSRAEKKYLKNKKRITMCIDPVWMPFESFKDGKHIGMSADYFKIIQKSLGVPIDAIQTETWAQSLAFAKARKCDIMSMVMQTPERKEYLNFTEPYFKTPLVIATKADVPFINDITSIGDKKIGIPGGYAFSEILKKKYPQLNIVEVENIEDGLQRVHEDKLFGYIGSLATIGYMFQTKYTGELKIAGKFDHNWELGVGVRNDDEVLLGIFNKAIKNIDRAQRQKILNKWVAIKYEKGTDYTLIWQILVVVFFVILLGMYRNNILKKSNSDLKIAKKRADEKTIEVQQEREKFKYMLSATMEAIAIYEDGVCIELNNAAVEMYGYNNKDQILGRRALDFVAPSSHKLVLRNIHREYAEPYEITALKADGTEFPVSVKVRMYYINGKRQRISTVLDLTQFKKNEEELIVAKEIAEEATKIKADFLSNMSHEIRTPMNGIVGMLHLLGKTSLDDKQLGYIKKVKTASNNLLYIINDVLDFSKLEAGKLEVHSVDFDMNKILENVKDLVELKATEKGLSFSIEFLETDSIFYGDSLRLSQILINLTNNAIKFTHKGEVKLTLKQIRDDIVRFSVKDTGIGINKQQQEELFQSFKQADSTITRKYGGSGLGLSISKELIELMDGKIWLRSEVDKGSEFLFELRLPKGNIEKLNELDVYSHRDRVNYTEQEIIKEDISQVKRDALFYELKEVVKTSRPKSCDPVVEKMQKYNFSDKDAKIFKDIQMLLKKYKFKEILEMLDGQI